MSASAEQKIKVSVGLTGRVVTAIASESKRKGISFNEMVRCITNDWCDVLERSLTPPEPKVLVLDRDKRELRGAR